jgi:hypothetical protein
MLEEHTHSTKSLDLINDAIIKNTFLGYKEEPNTKEIKEDDSCCCSDKCFKWWFFHSSFQAPNMKTDLLHQRKQFYCCDVCSECLEIKLLNYCVSRECVPIECMKEHCSDCFYNGCQLSCCCFTFILTTK